MAISVNWPTKVIYVPKADMTLVQSSPYEVRELELNSFHLILRGLEDDEDGIPFVKTHIHNTETLLGGVTYARVIEIINGYTITFEDGNYAVQLVGANSNVGDVVNLNSVSVRSANSAGLQTVGSGLTTEEHNYLLDVARLTGNKVVKSGDTVIIYEEDGTTIWKQYDISDGGRLEL